MDLNLLKKQPTGLWIIAAAMIVDVWLEFVSYSLPYQISGSGGLASSAIDRFDTFLHRFSC